MNEAAHRPPHTTPRSHKRTAAAVAGGAFFMLGMSFAAVPLYDMFCRMTGFGGTPMVAESAPAIRGERTIRVSFDANVGAGRPRFNPPGVNSAVGGGAAPHHLRHGQPRPRDHPGRSL